MRPKLNETEKRISQIGIKVKKDIKSKIMFISEREGHPMSTQINLILEQFVADYTAQNDIRWEEFTLDEEEGKPA